MFYLLPFNDKARMEALQKLAHVEGEMATFLAKMEEDLRQRDTISQLQAGWLLYLEKDSVRAGVQMVVVVEARFGQRRLSQQESEKEGERSQAGGSAEEEELEAGAAAPRGSQSSSSHRLFQPPPHTLSDP